MDLLQFLAAVVGALAWPVTLVLLVTMLREPLGRVLLTITKLKFKDLELDFGQQLKSLEEKARAVEVIAAPSVAAGGPKEPDELLSEAEELADKFPEPSVAVAWSAVEDELHRVVERKGIIGSSRRMTTGNIIRLLSKEDALDPGTVDVLKRMQNLRNMAMHERTNAFGGISADEAREFIAFARGISKKLRGLS